MISGAITGTVCFFFRFSSVSFQFAYSSWKTACYLRADWCFAYHYSALSCEIRKRKSKIKGGRTNSSRVTCSTRFSRCACPAPAALSHFSQIAGTNPKNHEQIGRKGLLPVGHPDNPSKRATEGTFGACDKGIYVSIFVDYCLPWATKSADPLQPGDEVQVLMVRCSFVVLLQFVYLFPFFVVLIRFRSSTCCWADTDRSTTTRATCSPRRASIRTWTQSIWKSFSFARTSVCRGMTIVCAVFQFVFGRYILSVRAVEAEAKSAPFPLSFGYSAPAPALDSPHPPRTRTCTQRSRVQRKPRQQRG